MDVFSHPFVPAGTILYAFRMPQPAPRQPPGIIVRDTTAETLTFAMGFVGAQQTVVGAGSIGEAAGVGAAGTRMIAVSAATRMTVIMAHMGAAATRTAMSGQ